MTITPYFRKKMADSWFSYLQNQICKEFEYLEDNKIKFYKKEWNKKKKNEGGGTSFLLTGGKIFDKVGVNKSTVSGVFAKKFRSKILGAGNNGKYWASGVSVVAHMKNPKVPAIHFNTRFIVTSKEWFGGGMDVTPSHKDEKEKKIVNRRDFLFTATYTVGAVGVGAVIWPMIDQMNPDKAQQALATTEVDISNIEPGKSITVLWRGKPVFLKRRTQEEIAEARAVNLDDLPDPQKDEDRVKEGKDEWLVMLGVCTHLGCVPLKDKGDFNGWFCPCHGSHYDVSGRIRKGPAPTNMEIPKFEFVDRNIIKIG